MSLNQKIQKLREASGLTQETMAEKLNMSKNTYGRIERGETILTERKLERIASVFEINDWSKIKSTPEDQIFLLLAENNHTETQSEIFNLSKNQTTNNYYNQEQLTNEIEKLQLIINHKDELLAQKDQELTTLRSVIKLLEKQ